jgi:hypothetical protein
MMASTVKYFGNPTVPRGFRNNNPGNIEKGATWQGLSTEGDWEPRFAVFKAPEWGIRAIARILITYRDKHGINTVRGIIDRWAPPIENDTPAYAAHVAGLLKVSTDEIIDVTEYRYMRPLVAAIIQHENGSQPYSDELIKKGLILAGVEPPTKPISKSRTVSGASAAGVAAVAAPVVAQVTDALETAQTVAPIVETLLSYSPWVLAVLGVAAAGYVIYRRVQDQQVRFS